MEIQKYKEIEATIKALEDEFKLFFEEIGKLSKTINELKVDNKNSPLVELIGRLTKTSRRHDIDSKIIFNSNPNNFYTVGTNHFGLGYEDTYSSILEPLSYSKYGSNRHKEQYLRDILFNQDAIIDLTSIIKKSNQKTFLKAIKILEKYNLKTSFDNYNSNNLKNIDIVIKNSVNTISINLGNSDIDISIKDKDLNRLFNIEIGTNDLNIPTISIEKEKNDLLKNISDKRYMGNMNINDIKLMIYFTQHKEIMLEAIKSKRELLNSVKNDYTNEHKELNELLQPLLALEKL